MVDGSTNIFTRVYGVINQTGVLDQPLVRQLFASAYFGYKRLLEDPFACFLKAHPHFLHGGHIIDVGANLGYTAKTFADYVEAPYLVYAFEPDRKNFEILEKVARCHKLQRIVALKSALGESESEAELWINPAHHGDHRIVTADLRQALDAGSKIEKTKMTTLDAFWKNDLKAAPVSFIKIDVQGYEVPVLNGALLLLKERRDIKIAVEYDPKALSSLGFETNSLFDFLAAQQFNIYHLNRKGQLSQCSNEKIAPDIEGRGYTDLLVSRAPLI